MKVLLLGLLALGGLSAGGILGLRLMTAEVEEEDGRLAEQVTVTATPADVTPTPDLSLSPSPVPVRPDCPADWNVYEHPDPDRRFSVCYPVEMEASLAQPPRPLEIPPEVQLLIDQGLAEPPPAPRYSAAAIMHPLPSEGVDYNQPETVYTGDRVILDLGYTHQWSVEAFGPDTKCLDEMWEVKNRTVTVAQLTGRSAQACYQEVFFPGPERGEPKLLYKAIYFPLFRLAPGDIVGGTVLWTGPNWDETEALAKQILSTLVIR